MDTIDKFLILSIHGEYSYVFNVSSVFVAQTLCRLIY